jgi:hypothetical protein
LIGYRSRASRIEKIAKIFAPRGRPYDLNAAVQESDAMLPIRPLWMMAGQSTTSS